MSPTQNVVLGNLLKDLAASRLYLLLLLHSFPPCLEFFNVNYPPWYSTACRFCLAGIVLLQPLFHIPCAARIIFALFLAPNYIRHILQMSGRQDSNLRLLAPKASALTGLSYSPCLSSK